MTRTLVTILAAAAIVTGAASPSSAYPRPGTIERVTATGFAGVEARGTVHPSDPSSSKDGRYIAFESNDPTLVKDDDKLAADVFVFDRSTREMELITVSTHGIAGLTEDLTDPFEDEHNSRDLDPSISADGRYVAFSSPAPNLVPGDTNGVPDIFIRDRIAGITARISVSSDQSEGKGGGFDNAYGSFDPQITGSGRYVVFASESPNLVRGDANNSPDVFIRDRRKNTTERASVATGGGDADRGSTCASISDDGRYVAFASTASNLVVDYGSNRGLEVYVRDRAKKTTEMVSVDSHAQRGGGLSGVGVSGNCGDSSISGNGRYVVFRHFSKFVPNDNGLLNRNVYMHDRTTGRTTRVSVNSFGEEAEWGGSDSGGGLSISRDGRFVAFVGRSGDLVDGDTSACHPHPLVDIPSDCGGLAGDSDVFIHDTATGSTEMASVDGSGREGEECASTDENQVALSDSGRFVAFSSCSTTLVPDDTNALWDVFVRDRGPILGTGGLESSSAGDDDPTQICAADICLPPVCIQDICLPPGGVTTRRDASSDLSPSSTPEADLYEVSLAYRPQYDDLFAAIELDDMPTVRPGLSPIFYGLRFEVEDKTYEVRATPLLGGTFGLFDCTGSRPLCTKVADLRGGYGTTGMRVVFSLPLDAIGLEKGGELKDVTAFSGLGNYMAGATKVLDFVKLK